MSKEKMVTEQFKVHVKWKIKCATLTEHVKVFNHYIYLLNHFIIKIIMVIMLSNQIPTSSNSEKLLRWIGPRTMQEV